MKNCSYIIRYKVFKNDTYILKYTQLFRVNKLPGCEDFQIRDMYNIFERKI